MHRIKRQAKRDAWYNDDGATNFNPFGKLWKTDTRDSRTKSRGGAGDLETGAGGLNRRQTEGDTGLMSSPEAARQKDNWGDDDMIQAQTEPPVKQRQRSSGSDRGISTEKEAAFDAPTGESSSGRGSDAIATGKSETGGTTDNEVRNRDHKPKQMGGLLGKLHMGKDKHEEGDDDEDEKKKSKATPHFTVWSQIQNTIFNSPINILLPLVPTGIILGFAFEDKVPPAAIFVINFIAIVPLAGLLSYATEELAIRVGETLGGLLNASFGNAVELIVSILALFNNQYIIVQTSLVGSMLSNLLLVMGMCFFFGGRNKIEQHFNVTVAQTAASLLALAIGALIIPTVFNEIVGSPQTGDPNKGDSTPIDKDKSVHISAMSRGTSVLLLFTYGAYLYFQLSTHAAMYNAPSKKAERRKPKKSHDKGDAMKAMLKHGTDATKPVTNDDQKEEMDEAVDSDDEDEEEVPKLSLVVAIATLCISTILVALCAEKMTKSINDIATPESGISQEFVGLILLPIVGNAAEHATAVTVAIKDKMDLAIGVAVGSSMQIALLVIPLVIVIGWCAGKDEMTLAFDGFQVIVLFVAVLLVNYLIGDGKSHWLEGVLLMVLYVIIAVAAWFYPVNQSVAG